MRLVRIGEAGAEKPGVMVDEAHYVDVSDLVPDFDTEFFDSFDPAAFAAKVQSLPGGGQRRPLAGVRVGPPLARPHQIICVGLNYRDHAAETGAAIPDEPILFSKSPNTLVGPDDDVLVPRGSAKMDWEIELGVVIRGRALYLKDEAAAEQHIAGYTVVNDLSERAFQLERGGQWMKGKSAPTFNPAGPFLVTPGEIPDVHALGMRLEVDGTRRQDGTSADMIFSPSHIVWYVSQFMALEPGDLINTGTPAGVGLGLHPPVFLHGGETLTLSIDALGTQRQHVKKTAQ